MYETKRQSMSFVACLRAKMSSPAKFSVSDADCRLAVIRFISWQPDWPTPHQIVTEFGSVCWHRSGNWRAVDTVRPPLKAAGTIDHEPPNAEV